VTLRLIKPLPETAEPAQLAALVDVEADVIDLVGAAERSIAGTTYGLRAAVSNVEQAIAATGTEMSTPVRQRVGKLQVQVLIDECLLVRGKAHTREIVDYVESRGRDPRHIADLLFESGLYEFTTGGTWSRAVAPVIAPQPRRHLSLVR